MKNTGRKALTIGQVAKLSGVGVETVRFYERKGLVDPPKRSTSGYRHYPPEAVDRVGFIRQAKNLGFTLREVEDLLSLRVAPSATCAEVRARAVEKVAAIEERIAGLQRMKEALSRLADRCRARGPTSSCPIMEELERGDLGDAGN